MMVIPTKTIYAIFLGAFLLIGVSILAVDQVQAHGSIRVPLSRVYNCFLEGPENPQSEACRAAVAAGGTQQFYDWNGVNQLADGRHKEIIPDGQLCSGGKASHRGLDLARDDWTTQQIAPDANGNFEFVYRATAPHSTDYFEFYVTKDGYDPTQPLKWSDLEDSPFCTIDGVTLDNGQYRMLCPLPTSKSGKHLIYNIWQRDDSAEAFYSCSDVEFTTNSPLPSTTPTDAPATVTPAKPTPIAPTVTPIAPTATPIDPMPTATALPTEVPLTATPVGPLPTATVAPTPTSVPGDAACQVEYSVLEQWRSGFTADVKITNPDSNAIDGWLVEWTFPTNQQITHLWDGSFTQSGANVRVENAHWNTNVSGNGGTTSFGFVGSYMGLNQFPIALTLNGVSCQESTVARFGVLTMPESLFLPLVVK